MDGFTELPIPPVSKTVLTAAQVASGPPVLPSVRISGYSSEEWESFVEEWLLHCKKSQYIKLGRMTGSGDKGIDVAGFIDDDELLGVWDNYQCKHYDAALGPADAWPEIGKILWYSHCGEYKPPRKFYFIAPKNIGTKLKLFLSNNKKLKEEAIRYWESKGYVKLTDNVTIPFGHDFEQYVINFDFSIFTYKELSEILADHRNTPYHAGRFGGGLPAPPKANPPPDEIGKEEERYTKKLFDAYAQHKDASVKDASDLKKWKEIEGHFHRQREAFFRAERMRVFVREVVEPGTFESLQEEIYTGIVDTHDNEHKDGLARAKAVLKAAQDMSLDAHPLSYCAFAAERHGICHQLANEESDRITWVK